MRHVDVAVVGGGLAGISAALASAENGADTLLIDENDQIGGQLRWRLTPTIDTDLGLGVDPASGPEVAARLAERLEQRANLAVETGSVAWGLFEEHVLGLSNESMADQVQANAIVLATGSTDVTLPFPGWTLPGVMTARAAQIFMHVHRIRPGKLWAILGDTEEADELSSDIENAGAKVAVRWPGVDGFRASGTNRLAHVECNDEVHEVDGLAIALGRQPDPELAIQAQAEVAFNWELGGYTPLRDVTGLTSVPGVYVAGDAAGIGTLPELVAEGRLAGLAAAGADESAIEQAREVLWNVSQERRRQEIERLRISVAAD